MFRPADNAFGALALALGREKRCQTIPELVHITFFCDLNHLITVYGCVAFYFSQCALFCTYYYNQGTLTELA